MPVLKGDARFVKKIRGSDGYGKSTGCFSLLRAVFVISIPTSKDEAN
jgi:hypothetical protein